MNDNDKSREILVTEIAVLRKEADNFRNRKNGERTNDTIAEGERCRTLVREVPEYIYSIEYQDGKISSKFHSPQCEDITGYNPGDFFKNPDLWMEMIHECDRQSVTSFIEGLHEPLNCRSIEHRIIHKDGSVRWVVNMTTVHLDNEGSTLRQSGFLIDVTMRKQEEERILLISNESRRNSLIDDLTNLYNRRGFRELAEQQLRVADRIGQPVLLFFIDVDNFKEINDTYGHHAGDAHLVMLAEILKDTFRESDLIARIGGDEFTVLTMESSPDSSEVLIERLLANIEKENRVVNDFHALSVTAGVARYNLRENETIIRLIDRADKAMYEKKRSKRAKRNEANV